MRIKRGNPKEILHLFSKMPKDEEFANLLEDVIKEMRRELRLHKTQEVKNEKMSQQPRELKGGVG